MDNAESFIEYMKWGDFFKSGIVEFTSVFVSVILLLRVLSLFISPKASKLMIYVMKFIAYGIVVIMLMLYLNKDSNFLYNINIFTGFTFLFSSIEMIDNLGLAIQEIFGNNIMHRLTDKKILSKEEDRFKDYIQGLRNLYYSIKPGKITKEAKECVDIIIKRKYDKDFFFYNIERVLSNTLEETYPIEKISTEITKSDVFRMIIKYDLINTEKKKSPLPKITKKQCEDLKTKLYKVIQYENQYNIEKARLIKQKQLFDVLN